MKHGFRVIENQNKNKIKRKKNIKTIRSDRPHLRLVKIDEDVNYLKPKDSHNTEPVAKKRYPLLRKARYYWHKLLRLQGDPKVLARGIAVGVFVAITPTIPFHTTLILLLCGMLAANPLAGVAVSFIVSNPITIPLQYYWAWRLGTWITGNNFSWASVKLLLHQVDQAGFMHGAQILFKTSISLIYTMLVGGVVLALPFAILAYWIALKGYQIARKRRSARLAQKRKENGYG